LDAIQRRWLTELTRWVVRRSAFYASFADTPFEEWPVLDKRTWMSRFDDINTVGARLETIASLAQQAEVTRDFSATWHGHSVGLSTGTSGNRGLFLASPKESAEWAGTLLAKLMRRHLLARERIALVLRAGATLYENVGALRLRFRYFDQSRPWGELVDDLRSFDPTILVAPASALRLLARNDRALRPGRVVSVAEVLDDLDRRRIEERFKVGVEQIYQATEGLLGTSCEEGSVHLNEPYLLVEPEWQDSEHTRFIPIITDLRRRSQPVIRYRLNDILRMRTHPCPCGRASIALAAIEGREDDVLWLDGARGSVAVFPDLIARAIVGMLPDIEDYAVAELRRGVWSVGLRPLPTASCQPALQEAMNCLARRLGADPPTLVVSSLPAVPVVPRAGKQRRVRSAKAVVCAS
jgi:putative adenylate-forming enzyme